VGFKRFEDIRAWQSAGELAKRINVLAEQTALGKNYSLKDQICRAAGSAMYNIAEGYSRSSDRDFAHYLEIARGSAMEVQSQLYTVLDLGYINQQTFNELYDLAGRTAAMTTKLMLFLRQQGRKFAPGTLPPRSDEPPTTSHDPQA
jgi:four helix bundle protein